MILSHPIVALSLFFAPLALGRPASAPIHKLHPPAASTEPSALLGRRYIVHDHRDATRPRIYTYSFSSTSPVTASPLPQHTPRSTQPFAKYLADRSGDIWVRERPRAPAPVLDSRADASDEDEEATMKYVDYVSHVGPFAYEPPLPQPPPPSTITVTVSSQPSSTLAAHNQSAPASAPASSMSTMMPVMNLAAANATVASTLTSMSEPSPTTTVAVESAGAKRARKRRVKGHKNGRKEYKEKTKY